MRNIAIVQARMGSSRLPKKALLPINGIPIIQWILERLMGCHELDSIVFAIPNSKKMMYFMISCFQRR